jgi:hypothetical protein
MSWRWAETLRRSKMHFFILLVLLLSIASLSVDRNIIVDVSVQETSFTMSQDISGVPYVWQEVNGFCFPSALSMVLQSMGYDLSLYDILAASGAGFSMVSISFDEALTFLPGVMVRQIPWFEFFTDLYGLNMQFYLDSSTEYGWNAKQILQGWGSDYIDYSDSASISPITVMRESIDAGYPLAISVDTYYLPVEDWDVIRNYVGPLEPGGVGHAIVIVGYNDTAQKVRVYDPGVGLIGDTYGYPDDGRWNYTMPYDTLHDAWGSAGYVTFKISNGTGPITDFEDRLTSYITQKLLGNRSAYFEGYENYFYLSAGADAFRGMALDLNLKAIKDYCTYYLEVQKSTAMRMLGHNIEVMMTMQYLAFRSSLNVLPDLLPSKDLAQFLAVANEALPHMEVLSHNASITSGIEIKSRDTLLYNTFFGMASNFESSYDLDGAISEYSDELDEISTHLIAIADAWRAAGEFLADELDKPLSPPGNDLMIVIGGGVVVLVIGLVIIIWRKKPSLEE